MNNTFNLQRFSLLLKRQWLEFGKIYLITLAVAFGILISFYSFKLLPYLTELKAIDEYTVNFREDLFLIFGFIFISLIANSYFAHLGQKPKAIIDLMIPVSVLEKLVTAIFFTCVLPIIIYCLLFYLTDLAFLTTMRKYYSGIIITEPDGKALKAITYLPYFIEANFYRVQKVFYIAPFFINSIALLGSVYFNRYHYIKTAISVIIFFGVWVWVLNKVVLLTRGNKIDISSIDYAFVNNQLPPFWVTPVFIALTFVFWFITYIRLKEKEV